MTYYYESRMISGVTVTAIAPIYIVQSVQWCGRCTKGNVTPVYALAASGLRERSAGFTGFFRGVRKVDDRLAQFLKGYAPNWLNLSGDYWRNYCELCVYPFDDEQLHGDPTTKYKDDHYQNAFTFTRYGHLSETSVKVVKATGAMQLCAWMYYRSEQTERILEEII